MKLRTILLAGMLLSTPILSIANEAIDITTLIEEAKKSTSDKRFELINQIKAEIATMNEDDPAVCHCTTTNIKRCRHSIPFCHYKII